MFHPNKGFFFLGRQNGTHLVFFMLLWWKYCISTAHFRPTEAATCCSSGETTHTHTHTRSSILNWVLAKRTHRVWVHKSASLNSLFICQAFSASLRRRYAETALTFYRSFFGVGKKSLIIFYLFIMKMAATAAIPNYTAAFIIVGAPNRPKR